MEQVKGDSTRRQSELVNQYVKLHNMELDTSLKLHDAGISAFRGKNSKTGALKSFLDAVEDGTVKAGSVLLVESLDRLSRESVLDSLPTFLMIINAGVSIITLIDGVEHSRQSITNNSMNLFGSLLVMIRANEESRTKSERVGKAWANKRQNIETKKLTAQCPSWLKLSGDKKYFEVIPDRVQIIKKIFELCLQGYGTRRIADYLNNERIETWGRSIGWHQSYVTKILKNRAVIGEYQPMHYQDSERIPVGEVVLNYFPKIIDDSVFIKAENGMKDRLGKSGKTQEFQPLFRGILKCTCGANIRIINKGTNKGTTTKGTRWYKCSSNILKRCDSFPIRVDIFDYNILHNLESLDFSNEAMEGKKLLNTMENEIEITKQELVKIKSKIDNIMEAILQYGFNDSMHQKLKELEDTKQELNFKLKQLESKHIEKNVLSDSDINAGLTSSLYKLYENIDSHKTRLICSTYISKFVEKIIINEYGSRGAKVIFKSGNSKRVEIKDFEFDWIKRYKEVV